MVHITLSNDDWLHHWKDFVQKERMKRKQKEFFMSAPPSGAALAELRRERERRPVLMPGVRWALRRRRIVSPIRFATYPLWNATREAFDLTLVEAVEGVMSAIHSQTTPFKEGMRR